MNELLRKVPRKQGNLVELMLECHQRIRYFVRLACELGVREDAPLEQQTQACEEVKRYFSEALPLHVADEEESVLPRLREHSPQVAQALATMQRQHLEHGPKLEQLMSLMDELRQRPGDFARRGELADVARALEREFSEHLTLEEQLVFPSLSQLAASVQDEILAELRARRRR